MPCEVFTDKQSQEDLSALRCLAGVGREEGATHWLHHRLDTPIACGRLPLLAKHAFDLPKRRRNSTCRRLEAEQEIGMDSDSC